MARRNDDVIQRAAQAAREVLLHNLRHSKSSMGLPRTSAFGYPEPYTRDLMLSAPGMLVSGDDELIDSHRRTLEALARHQTRHGLIPGLADDPGDLGSSDTTPLFLIGLALYRRVSGQRYYLDHAARRALEWLDYQSPDDGSLVAQQPTGDWRDEQWVEGFGLYVNALVYIARRLHGKHKRADEMRELIDRRVVTRGYRRRHEHEGFALSGKPYYALWTLKVHSSDRFDLVGNSLAIIAGIPSRAHARRIIAWVEREVRALKASGAIALDLPPVLLPFIETTDPDWRPRYAEYNRPGDYHNGGVWPFACALYVAALVAAGRSRLAARVLGDLTAAVTVSRRRGLHHGFNEWLRAGDGEPCGHDWQTWSAAMYLYAVHCVERDSTPFFDPVRKR